MSYREIRQRSVAQEGGVFYCNNIFVHFITAYPPVTAALALLSPLSSNNAEAAFRDGTLVITEEMVKKAMPTLNQLKLIGEILGARRGTGEADLSPFRRYRIKDWIRARDIMNISVDQFMNRLKRRVDSGRWEEPSEKNWFNSYIEVASLKR